MTSHVARLYAAVGSLLAFFVAWAGIAAHPWKSTAGDPRLEALATREQQLRRDAKIADRIVARRFAQYRAALRQRQTQSQALAASVPRVRVVTLPPLTTTRTS